MCDTAAQQIYVTSWNCYFQRIKHKFQYLTFKNNKINYLKLIIVLIFLNNYYSCRKLTSLDKRLGVNENYNRWSSAEIWIIIENLLLTLKKPNTNIGSGAASCLEGNHI